MVLSRVSLMCSRCVSHSWCHFSWSRQNLSVWYIKIVAENPKLFNSVVSLTSLYCFVLINFISDPNLTQHSTVRSSMSTHWSFFFFAPLTAHIKRYIEYRIKHSRTFQCFLPVFHVLQTKFVPLSHPRLDINVNMGLASVSRKLVSCLVKVKLRLVKTFLSINATSLWKMPLLCRGPCGMRFRVCVCF